MKMLQVFLFTFLFIAGVTIVNSEDKVIPNAIIDKQHILLDVDTQLDELDERYKNIKVSQFEEYFQAKDSLQSIKKQIDADIKALNRVKTILNK